ncbi:hypothetical protein PNA2_1192 [Pyrococcus sp. NA2]|uniref:DUF7344 domain-containing protein n=1 Tax=Pyrococcus sp. (strain NA2) TaxID=342949 RepID=UPI000209ABE7|nr:hypothetical protein [Pyrococcus sp. NA2]AEC52107.1 hypothetical protein PNA2_1192 [Pyrococcus sp. NA2]
MITLWTKLIQSQSSTILGNDRRLMVIEYLRKHGNEADISELVNYICRAEKNESRRHRKSVYVSLVQTHLPKLQREGIVNVKRGKVYLMNMPSEVSTFITIKNGRVERNLWPLAYLFFSSLTLLASLIIASSEGTIFSLLLLALAIFHWISTR